MHSTPDSPGKLIYCTRTIKELQQCMDELKRLVQYRKEVLGSKFKPVTGLCLSSRRNLCIHPKINKQDIRTQVDISMNPLSSFP